jgi:hypothetical protein
MKYNLLNIHTFHVCGTIIAFIVSKSAPSTLKRVEYRVSLSQGGGEMGEKIEALHRALMSLVSHVGEGSRIFIIDEGSYHKFRVEHGCVSHTESHTHAHVEKGRGQLRQD